MLKRQALIFISLLVMVLPVSAKVIRVTLQLPESHALGQNWHSFGERLKQRTGNKLSIKLFASAQLFKDDEVPKAVATRSIEAGSAFLGRFVNAVPLVDIVSLPFLFKNERHWRKAVSPGSPMRVALDQAILKKTGVRVLWWQAYGRNIYLSKNSPVRLPKDIKNKKVRSYGKVQSWTIEAMGGMPLLVSGSRQFSAYQRGLVDIAMTGVSAVKARKLYEVMNNLSLTFDSAIEFVAVINNDFFESLPKVHQKIIMEEARVVEQNLRDSIYQTEENEIEALRSKMKVISLRAQDREQWEQATSQVMRRFIEFTGKEGERLIDVTRKIQFEK